MSILIKGMEMPTNCGECLLAKLSPTGESLICNYMLSRVSWEERPFDCPLVTVPPHGRLIDADALCDLIDNGFDLDFDEVPETKRELLRMIADAPTILEAEEG